MENPKSHAQDQILVLVIQTIADAYAYLRLCDPSCIRKDDQIRDVNYLIKRVRHEGLSFLTVRLPILGEFMDKIMWGEQGLQRVEGFKPYDGLYPCFLRPFWVFLERSHTKDDAETARMYRILRTLLFGLKKLALPYTEEQAASKLASFEAIEEELKHLVIGDEPFILYSQLALDDLLSTFNADVERPKHGPGAVAGGERHNAKWTWTVLYESVHDFYPYWEHMFPVRSAIGDGSGRSRALQLAANVGTYRSLRREKEPTARLLMVPKDSKGPRIISCEPKELMYLQQGVAYPLMKLIERHPLTRGHVNFERQDINASLALESSYSRSRDTIDLSDASDRVSCALVTLLFPKRLVPKLLALRSSATLLPDGRVLKMTKYAPMGSALCFPIESLVFWAIAVGSIWNETHDLTLACQAVHVYGDDIIIASEYTNLVMKNLEVCGLCVNRHKSFFGNHPFRESCGIEAWKGHDVTPLRVKKLPPRRPVDGDALVAWIKYAENTQKLCPARSKYELDVVERYLGPIPRVPFPQNFLSIVTDDDHWGLLDYREPRWCNATSYWQAKLYVVKSRRQVSAIPGWSRLQRNLIQRALEGEPSIVVDRASTLISKRRVNITYLGL
ncbi:TPA_asm: RNA-directed RNA polymerase [ssRNA phage SRR7976325_11]|uniref:RNA-directed RNA polymerase n=1 Tax=ssRNA phage SRR7976325_11 TaxID=2786698 RepID=A0A8S5L1F2_9VIRU|nr:RNA-directed RNA polymerase [ssRNA phage SRR7976325_11]DAD51181.1 TPA_asm: RNA-directed RNA polymerase [ssRNA phage SRR7976325_11]